MKVLPQVTVVLEIAYVMEKLREGTKVLTEATGVMELLAKVTEIAMNRRKTIWQKCLTCHESCKSDRNHGNDRSTKNVAEM